MSTQMLAPHSGKRIPPAGPRLASVAELESPEFRAIMTDINGFAGKHGLRQFTDWSKVWEYPWLWTRGLDAISWPGKSLVDFGSEISPVPWLLASRGARVTLIETDRQWLPHWEALRRELGVEVDWRFVADDSLPLPDASADAVTSFSVIEHQNDKARAVSEIARVLKPDSPLFLSFDICEAAMGMTFPDWNGRALTLDEFEREIWEHPKFRNAGRLEWNVSDIPSFKEWHLRSAPHHNYVTGTAVLIRR
jgi:SAM-dependent methyltransferase